VRTLFSYGDGIPRYLGIWMVTTPVLVLGLRRFGVPRAAVAVVFLTTLPSLSRNPPWWFEVPARLWILGAACIAITAWLVQQIRASRDSERPDVANRELVERGVDWRWAVGLAALALALRVPLAWWDPGISDIPTSTEIAAEQLLDGDNPYTLPNPDTQVGHYQYPAGSILAHLPFVALQPDRLFGEEHVGVRVAIWFNEAVTVVLLLWAGALVGRSRAGQAAAFAYAMHPVLLREAGQTVANDLILATLVLGAAVALARRRPMLGAVLVGLAISVKPVVVAALPVVLVAVGWQAAAAAVLVAVGVQLPFLLFPTPGTHGLRWILEPVGRAEIAPVLRANSLWWPVYLVVGTSAAAIKTASRASLALCLAAAAWAGWQLRRTELTLERLAAAFALPLFLAWATASMQRTNYQCWYLAPFLLAVGLRVAEPPPSVRGPMNRLGASVRDRTGLSEG
jgi:hypothetical protein